MEAVMPLNGFMELAEINRRGLQDIISEQELQEINGGVLPILAVAGAVAAVAGVVYIGIQIGEYVGKATYYATHP
ncbi:MAG: class IIb bacteriocin, lactobin A/cerein 7B family [Thermoanaerobacteraceae bacterium]|nr:class IIb bacteriocin, lactobin A/cerein 7B family [Thermoanaerobacteraceae bacterium]